MFICLSFSFWNTQDEFFLELLVSIQFPLLLLSFSNGTGLGKAGYIGVFALVIETPEYFAQQAKILVITHTLQNIPQAINILSDSQYSVHATKHVETATA